MLKATASTDLPGVHRALVIAGPDTSEPPARLVLFLAGFLTSPWSYRQLLTQVADDRTLVVAPRMYRPGPAVLAGRFTADDEAERAATVVELLIARHDPAELWLAGHSRGGQVAWLLANRIDPAGVIAFDPVDGIGRNPSGLHAAAAPAGFASRTLVVGAGVGDRCAPSAVNHEHFAGSGPPGTVHVIVPTMGHGDLLDDRPAWASRHLCGGSAQPQCERATVGELATGFLDGDLPEPGETAVPYIVQ